MYESDHRYADRLVKELGLAPTQIVTTPAVRESRVKPARTRRRSRPGTTTTATWPKPARVPRKAERARGGRPRPAKVPRKAERGGEGSKEWHASTSP